MLFRRAAFRRAQGGRTELLSGSLLLYEHSSIVGVESVAIACGRFAYDSKVRNGGLVGIAIPIDFRDRDVPRGHAVIRAFLAWVLG